MPIEVELVIKKSDKELLGLLNQCPAISKLTPQAPFSQEDPEIRFAIYSIAIKTDIYGDMNQINIEDLVFLKQFESETIFTPENLKFSKIIGDFNINLLQFIKYCALKTNSEITIQYEHERGDYLYEAASWYFNYLVNNSEIAEQFCINKLDGTDELQNFARLTKYKDGQIIVEDFKDE